MFRWLAGIFSTPRADAEKQQGDVHALDRADDPRGGVQDEEYRHAAPVEIVDESFIMSDYGATPRTTARRPAS